MELRSHIAVGSDLARRRVTHLRHYGLAVYAQSKVAQLSFILSGHEDVGAFDVTVDDVAGVDVPDGLAHLKEVFQDAGLWEWVWM